MNGHAAISQEEGNNLANYYVLYILFTRMLIVCTHNLFITCLQLLKNWNQSVHFTMQFKISDVTCIAAYLAFVFVT